MPLLDVAKWHGHDLRHFFASALIASGLDVEVVRARLHHASVKTTLDTYAHLMPDRDNASRRAVDAVFADRLAESLRTVGDRSRQRSRSEARQF